MATIVRVTRVIEIEVKCEGFVDMGGMSFAYDTEVKRIESEYMLCNSIEHAVREACMALESMKYMRDATLMGCTAYEIRHVNVSEWSMTNVKGVYPNDYAQRWYAAVEDVNDATIKVRLSWADGRPYMFPRIYVNGNWFADYIDGDYVNDMEVEAQILSKMA